MDSGVKNPTGENFEGMKVNHACLLDIEEQVFIVLYVHCIAIHILIP